MPDISSFDIEFQRIRENPSGLYLALLYLQLVLYVFAALLSSIKIWLFYTTKLFHFNIRVLLINEGMGVLVYVVFRVYIVVSHLMTSQWKNSTFEFLAMSLTLFPNWSSLTILIERMYSTIYSNNYERSSKLSLLYTLTGAPWCLTMILVVYIEIAGIEVCYQGAIIIFVATIVYTMGFLLLLVVNSHRAKIKNKLSLTQRFQVGENIKIVKMMVVTSIFYVATNIVHMGFVYYLFVYAFFNEYVTETLIASTAFDVFHASRCIVEPILMFSSNRDYRAALFKKKNRVRPVDKNVNDIYFTLLRKQWS